MSYMSDVNVRNVPDDLVRQVKSKAALEGKTLREITIEAFERYAKEKEKPLKVRRTARK